MRHSFSTQTQRPRGPPWSQTICLTPPFSVDNVGLNVALTAHLKAERKRRPVFLEWVTAPPQPPSRQARVQRILSAGVGRAQDPCPPSGSDKEDGLVEPPEEKNVCWVVFSMATKFSNKVLTKFGHGFVVTNRAGCGGGSSGAAKYEPGHGLELGRNPPDMDVGAIFPQRTGQPAFQASAIRSWPACWVRSCLVGPHTSTAPSSPLSP